MSEGGNVFNKQLIFIGSFKRKVHIILQGDNFFVFLSFGDFLCFVFVLFKSLNLLLSSYYSPVLTTLHQFLEKSFLYRVDIRN